MIVTTTRVWVITLLLGLLGMAGTRVQTAHAQSLCPSNSQQDFCSDFHWLMGNLSPISGRSSSPDAENSAVEKPILPSAGALIYEDFVEVEQKARGLLEKGLRMRESISPYKNNNDFDNHLRKLDFKAGWEDLPYGGAKPGYESATTFAQLVNLIEADLTESRDLYAFLTVFAPEGRRR